MKVRHFLLMFFVLSIGTACAGPGGTSSQTSPIATGVTLQSTNTPALPTSAPAAAPTATLSLTSIPTASPPPTPTMTSALTAPAATTASLTPAQALAQLCQQDPNDSITRLFAQRPIMDLRAVSTVSGTVHVFGTANRPNLAYSKLQVSGDDRKTWTDIGQRWTRATIDDFYGQIFGSANHDNFSYFQLELSADQKNWTSLRRSTQPAIGDTLLLAWNSRTVPNGEYWLRLLVVDKTGNYNEPCAVHIVIRN